MSRNSCHRKPDTFYHFILVSLGFLIAFLPQIAMSEWQHFIQGRNVPLVIHGAAQTEQVDRLLSQSELKPYGSSGIKIQKNEHGFASKGQSDVSLLQFQIAPSKDAYLQEFTLAVDNFGDINIAPELQLYHEKKLLATVPVLEGKVFFGSIQQFFPAGQAQNFEIKAKIANYASAGQRIRIGFQSPEDLKIVTEGENSVRFSNTFPLWGAPISVVGHRVQ